MSKFAGIIERFIPDTQAAFRRFPLAILMAAALTVIIIIKANDSQALSNEMMLRLVGGVVLAGYLSVILTLFGEGRGKTVSILVKAATVIIALLAGYFFRQLSFVTWAGILAAILFLGSAPFWKQDRDDIAVWDFTHKLWTAVVFTIAGAIIYLLGLLAIDGALDNLFNLNINKLLENWLFPIGFAFLAPIAWLSMLPRHDDDGDDSLRNPGFVSRAAGLLGTWILAPLTMIYAVIILAYAVKILLIGALPNGETATLVTPFLIVGTLTWLILDPPFIQEKRLARWYHKTWFWIMVPAALLLMAAVYIRISDYGWTVRRYLLVLAGIWALGVSLWFIIKGEKGRDIRIIPGFAALLLTVGSIGPWGADGLSASSQARILEKALIANNMLVESKSKLRPVGELSHNNGKPAQMAIGALEYLIEYKKEAKLKKFLSDEDATKLIVYNEMGNLFDAAIIERFGLADASSRYRYNATRQTYSFGVNDGPIDIRGFEIVSPERRSYPQTGNTSHTRFVYGAYEIGESGQSLFVKYNEETIQTYNVIEWLVNQSKDAALGSIDTAKRFVLYSEGNIEIVIVVKEGEYSPETNWLKANAYIKYVVLIKGIE